MTTPVEAEMRSNVMNPLGKAPVPLAESETKETHSSTTTKKRATNTNATTGYTTNKSNSARAPIRGRNRVDSTTLKDEKDVRLDSTTMLQKLRASETASFSLSNYATGLFRFLYTYAFFQAFLFGFAISVSIVLNSSFVSTRSIYWQDTVAESVLWIFLTPIVNLIFAWLLDEALDVMMDTLKHSPWLSLDPLIVNERQKFVYLSTGGSRPVLLNLRSAFCAILCAAFVWPNKETFVETQEKDMKLVEQTIRQEEEEEEEEEEVVEVVSQSKVNAKDGDLMDDDPLFVPPDWAVMIVETFFWGSFVLFPICFCKKKFCLVLLMVVVVVVLLMVVVIIC
jgi:hypothetical protein